jgi:hypothetical protein
LIGCFVLMICFELVDQLLDWEDVLDFIQRAEQASKNGKQDGVTTMKSPSIVPTIPVEISSLKMSVKKPEEKNENLELNKRPITPMKTNKKGIDNKFNEFEIIRLIL